MNFIKRQKLKKLKRLLLDGVIDSPTSANLSIVDNSVILQTQGLVKIIFMRYEGSIGISNNLPDGYSIKLNKNIIKIRNINYRSLQNDGLLFSAVGNFEIKSCNITCFNGNRFYATINNVDKDQLIGRSDTNVEDETLIIEQESEIQETQIFKSYIDDDSVLGLYTSKPIFENGYTGYYNYYPRENVYLTGKIPHSDSLPLYKSKLQKNSEVYEKKIDTVLRRISKHRGGERIIDVGEDPIIRKRILDSKKRVKKIVSRIRTKDTTKPTRVKVERKGY